MDLAEVLELQSKREQATEALQKALDLHERKGNVLVAGRTCARLAELSA